ncbi:MAG: AMP-binding protein, partial [Deltaproteobacteria bacterium]|nr:AMP-binding protein [Deltaproteobacteria bacterium]
MNFRFTAEDIGYCADIVEAETMVFGEEFIGRIDDIKENLKTIDNFIFVGSDEMKPSYAEAFVDFLETSSLDDPGRKIGLLDEAALYFTSGTTGSPKPILLTHRNLETACITENRHHNQTHEDTFL